MLNNLKHRFHWGLNRNQLNTLYKHLAINIEDMEIDRAGMYSLWDQDLDSIDLGTHYCKYYWIDNNPKGILYIYQKFEYN